MTMLPALIQIKLVKAGAFEFSGCKLVVCVQDVQRRVGRVFLDAGLPRHTATAALVRLIEVLIAEHLVVVIVLGAGGVPLCPPCGSAALIPCFSTFFACHKKPRLPRMPVGRLQSVPCKQRPPGRIRAYIYLCRNVKHSFSPLCTDFTPKATLSGTRGAERHPVGVGRVVVVAVTVVVHIGERRRAGRLRRPQPPPPCSVVAALLHAVLLAEEAQELRVFRLTFRPASLAEHLRLGEQEQLVFGFYALTVHDLDDCRRRNKRLKLVRQKGEHGIVEILPHIAGSPRALVGGALVHAVLVSEAVFEDEEPLTVPVLCSSHSHFLAVLEVENDQVALRNGAVIDRRLQRGPCGFVGSRSLNKHKRLPP